MRFLTTSLMFGAAMLLGAQALAQAPAPTPTQPPSGGTPEQMPFATPYGTSITADRAVKVVAAVLATAPASAQSAYDYPWCGIYTSNAGPGGAQAGMPNANGAAERASAGLMTFGPAGAGVSPGVACAKRGFWLSAVQASLVTEPAGACGAGGAAGVPPHAARLSHTTTTAAPSIPSPLLFLR